MARSTLARTGTVVLLAAALAACDRTPTGTTANTVLPPSASLVRGTNSGNGKGPGTTADQPAIAISPTELSLAVGQQAIVSVTLFDRRGDIIPVTQEVYGPFYGCYKVADSDPDCWSVVSIVPGGTNNRQATITGKAPGTVLVYGSDDQYRRATSLVTVR